MNKLHDALETCLRGLQDGQGMDAVLRLHPEFAEELRPLLMAAEHARAAGSFSIPAEITRRGRARLMARAAEGRKPKPQRGGRFFPAWHRAVITLGLVGVLVLSSTGLVSASTGALPGDQLYSVKRTWEDVQLFFVQPQAQRELLESRFEQERLNEIGDLLGMGRTAPITFSGLVMQQQDGRWLVSGIQVSITSSTNLPAGAIGAGEPVVITGLTRNDSTVEAQGVQLMQPGSSFPPLEPSGNEDQPAVSAPGLTVSGSQSSPAAPSQASYTFTGIVESMQAGTWRINGQPVFMDQATIIGSAKEGSSVKFDGYYSTDGRFVVTRLVVQASPAQQRVTPGGDSSKGSGGSGGGGGGGDDGGDGGGD